MSLTFSQPLKSQSEHDRHSDDPGDSTSGTDTSSLSSTNSNSSPNFHLTPHTSSSHTPPSSPEKASASHVDNLSHHRSSYEELFSHSSNMDLESQSLQRSWVSTSQSNLSDSQLYILDSDFNPNYQSMRSSTPISFSSHRTPLARRLSTGSSITINSSDRPLYMTRYQYSIIVHKLRQESKPLTYDNIHQEGLIMFQEYRSFYTGNI